MGSPHKKPRLESPGTMERTPVRRRPRRTKNEAIRNTVSSPRRTESVKGQTANRLKTETYADIEKMLRKIAWDFYKVNGNAFGDLDELFAETCLAFVHAYDSYCPEKGAFTTHVFWTARGRLLTRKRSLLRHTNTKLKDCDLYEAPPDTLRTLIADLSNDAAILANLTINPPAGLRRCIEAHKRSRVGTRMILKQYLDGLQWTKERIRRAFLELQDALHDC